MIVYELYWGEACDQIAYDVRILEPQMNKLVIDYLGEVEYLMDQLSKGIHYLVIKTENYDITHIYRVEKNENRCIFRLVYVSKPYDANSPIILYSLKRN